MDEFKRVTDMDDDCPLPQPITIAAEPPLSPPVSRTAQVKSEFAKHFLDEHFQGVFRRRTETQQRREQFLGQLQQEKISRKEKKSRESEFKLKESTIMRVTRRALRPEQFTKVRLIGRGAFGDVYVVRDKDGEIYAMKVLKKREIVAKDQILNALTERAFLSQSNNPWAVQLFYAFADAHNLYLVMDFLPGGDLMTLLIKRNIFTETETKFFIAETLLAIHHVHLAQFIHRDIKPDNLLLTKNGHIRLADFGLSTKIDRVSDPLCKLVDELTEIQQRDDPSLDSAGPDSSRRDRMPSVAGTLMSWNLRRKRLRNWNLTRLHRGGNTPTTISNTVRDSAR
jgi:protein-serine/threonine kinase